MGLPARKMEAEKRSVGRSAVRAVRSSGARRRTRRASRVSSMVTQVVAVAVTVLALAGVARVAVAVRAAEAAIDAHRLERSIRSEVLESRALEADCSALEAPSRIGALASSTLNMRAAASPRYIQVPGVAEEGAQNGSHARRSAASKASGAFAAFVEDLVAGEAQALLIGDVGLASSR